jgi:hypothetical protein
MFSHSTLNTIGRVKQGWKIISPILQVMNLKQSLSDIPDEDIGFSIF